MEYVKFGRTGLKVSRLCLGCMSYGTSAWRPWVLDEAQSYRCFQTAFELGFNFFDTADMYSRGVSEEVTGRAVREYSSRDQTIIATKAYYPTGDGPNDRGLSRKHLFDAIDSSLRRLGTDYIDLFQIHRWDSETPIEETLRALDDIVSSGKARYVGASSCYSWQFAQALAMADQRGWARFDSMQNHYNLVYREEEREMIPLCRAEEIAIIPWSPLARGLLARPQQQSATVDTLRSKTDDLAQKFYTQSSDFEIAARCHQVAERRGIASAQIALAWLLCQPGVTAPIVGATQPGQIEEMAGALDVQLDETECKFLEEKYQPHAVVGMSAGLPR